MNIAQQAKSRTFVASHVLQVLLAGPGAVLYACLSSMPMPALVLLGCCYKSSFIRMHALISSWSMWMSKRVHVIQSRGHQTAGANRQVTLPKHTHTNRQV